MRPYIVQQGDFLTRLGLRFGFDPTEVWNHAKNQSLRSLRSNPEVLQPGDELWIPDDDERQRSPINIGTTNRFASKVPRVRLRLVVRDRKRALIANEDYEIEAPNMAPIKGTTGADGALEADVPIHLSQVQLTFPKREIQMLLRVGTLNPISEVSGVKQRLAQLGFFRGTPDEKPSDGLRDAIEKFQRKHQLNVTGEIDEATRTTLLDQFGS